MTHNWNKDGSELGESDWAWGGHDPDVDEDVRQVEDDQSSEEAEAMPRAAQINWNQSLKSLNGLKRLYIHLQFDGVCLSIEIVQWLENDELKLQWKLSFQHKPREIIELKTFTHG